MYVFLFPHTRVCRGGVCDGDTFQSQTEECNLHDCVCVLTEDAFAPISNSPPLDGPVGWIESDGVPGAHGDSEISISIGDQLAIGDEVTLEYGRECGFWWEQYRKPSSIRRTKSQNSNVSRLVLQLSLS